MSRDLHVDTLAIIANEDLRMFHLYTFYFSSPFRLTDHQHDINYTFDAGSETFLASGRLVGDSNTTETLEISNPTITLTLTGANEADIALALTENYNDKRVLIRRGFYDDTGETADSNIIQKPFIVFDGRVDSYNIDNDPESGESAVSWRISSHFADWEKVNGRKCTNTSAQSILDPDTGLPLFPDEAGFSHVYDQIGERTWGRVRS